MTNPPESRDDEEILDEEDDEDEGIVVMINEEGEEVEFGLLGSVDLDDKCYAILATLEQLESDEDDPLEITLVRWTVTDEAETFESIEDDDEHARVEQVATAFLVREGFVSEE